MLPGELLEHAAQTTTLRSSTGGVARGALDELPDRVADALPVGSPLTATLELPAALSAPVPIIRTVHVKDALILRRGVLAQVSVWDDQNTDGQIQSQETQSRWQWLRRWFTPLESTGDEYLGLNKIGDLDNDRAAAKLGRTAVDWGDEEVEGLVGDLQMPMLDPAGAYASVDVRWTVEKKVRLNDALEEWDPERDGTWGGAAGWVEATLGRDYWFLGDASDTSSVSLFFRPRFRRLTHLGDIPGLDGRPLLDWLENESVEYDQWVAYRVSVEVTVDVPMPEASLGFDLVEPKTFTVCLPPLAVPHIPLPELCVMWVDTNYQGPALITVPKRSPFTSTDQIFEFLDLLSQTVETLRLVARTAPLLRRLTRPLGVLTDLAEGARVVFSGPLDFHDLSQRVHSPWYRLDQFDTDVSSFIVVSPEARAEFDDAVGERQGDQYLQVAPSHARDGVPIAMAPDLTRPSRFVQPTESLTEVGGRNTRGWNDRFRQMRWGTED